MFKKGLSVLVMALFSASLFADIELSTSIGDVYHKGTDELAGSITMRVNDDDFSNASTQEPVFIRVTLNHQAVLADTLVNLNGSGDRTDAEIYLAMNLEDVFGFDLAASDETVSIVRWVAGEPALWIRVQSASSAWIQNQADDEFAPTTNMRVSWTFGISARNSYERGLNIPTDRRNLPFNTRSTDLVDDNTDDVDNAVSTLICVDLSDGNLETIAQSEAESMLSYDPIAYDENAEIVEGQYRASADTGINFTNDFDIARGKDRDCTVSASFPDKTDAPAVPLCVRGGNGNDDPDGWVCDDNTIIFTIRCTTGGDNLETSMYNGAWIRFTSVDANSGFRFDDDATSPEAAGVRVGTGSLTSSIDLVWNTGTQSIDPTETWTATVKVWRWYTNNTVDEDGKIDVVLNWEMRLVNHGGPEEIDLDTNGHGDFNTNNVDHNRFCDQSEFLVGSGSWDWGSFVQCTGNDSVLFFPYIPAIVGNDNFWAGLAVVNQGQIDLDSVTAHVYGEDGTRHTINLNPLGMNAQETWLITTDDNGAAVFKGYSSSNEGQEEGPSGADGDADASTFGTTRSSMFVVGDFNTLDLNEVDMGDLDGYLLIGKGGDIDGAYLPRNEEPEGDRHQAGDLPPMAKRVNASKVENYATSPATYPTNR